MLLRHFGEATAADRLERAVGAVLADGRTLTYDLAAKRDPAGTTAVTDAVIAAL
jgi:isocitrate dehydrogenase (NAD+)